MVYCGGTQVLTSSETWWLWSLLAHSIKLRPLYCRFSRHPKKFLFVFCGFAPMLSCKLIKQQHGFKPFSMSDQREPSGQSSQRLLPAGCLTLQGPEPPQCVCPPWSSSESRSAPATGGASAGRLTSCRATPQTVPGGRSRLGERHKGERRSSDEFGQSIGESLC